MMEENADVIFAAAGGCGIGALKAVAEAGQAGQLPYAIGVDADQDWMYPGRIIASMQKRVDVGVYTAIKKVVDGTFDSDVSGLGGILNLGISDGAIQASDLASFDELLADPLSRQGIETATGMNASEVRQIYKSMRDSIPQAVWDAIDELKSKILSGEVVVPVPTSDTIAALRARYG
jgi:basic membrane protein A